jgi:demethylsterigmatocystin 6-O-methyltransferase
MKMDNIIAQVQLLAKTADEAGRKKLIDSLKSLQYVIETPYDTLQRFAGLVSESVQPVCYRKV